MLWLLFTGEEVEWREELFGGEGGSWAVRTAPGKVTYYAPQAVQGWGVVSLCHHLVEDSSLCKREYL